MARHFTMTADGGSRGNPGPAAYGTVISENGKVIRELFQTIGVATNNVAEYNGLLAGLVAIHEIDPEATVDVKMDSKLVVEQMSGRWQIKHADMRDLAKQARAAHPASLVTYQWIPREENSHADRLANKALDGEVAVDFLRDEVAGQVQKNFLHERLTSDEVPTVIYLVRHGETPLTPYRKFSGSGGSDPELTEKGLQQARDIARELAARKPDVLLSSPMRRTIQTAEALSEATGLSYEIDEEWIEASFGTWDGKSPSEIKEEFPEDFQRWVSDIYFNQGGGESYGDVTDRIRVALVNIANRYPGKKVAIATHNVVTKAAARIALNAPAESIFHIDVLPCSITTINIWPSDGLTALRGLSERSHL